MTLFSGQNDAILAWLGKRVDFTLSPHTHLFWATSDLDGSILGAVGMGGRMGRAWGSVSAAFADPRAALPLVRAAVAWTFGYQDAQAAYVTISTKRTNWIQSLVRVIGFREVDRVKGGINSREDLIILKVTPETCRPWQQELRKLTRMHALEAC